MSATTVSCRPKGRALSYALGGVLLGVTVWTGWSVYQQPPYSSASDIGYGLGFTGGVLMSALFLYPLRKRVRWMRAVGPMRNWFRLHMFCGVAGPACIVFHSTLHLGSINATVAYVCMIVVAASGVVGRYLYGRIHHGLYGSRATVDEVRSEFDRLQASLQHKLMRYPELRSHVHGLLSPEPDARVGGLWCLLSSGLRQAKTERMAQRLITAMIAQGPAPDIGRAGPSPAELEQLGASVRQLFAALAHVTTFSTYERLFALWHVAHVPFVYLFVLTAVAHVVAVHVY